MKDKVNGKAWFPSRVKVPNMIALTAHTGKAPVTASAGRQGKRYFRNPLRSRNVTSQWMSSSSLLAIKK